MAKVAVVTGASSGIGQAIAAALEERGFAVARVSRRSEVRSKVLPLRCRRCLAD